MGPHCLPTRAFPRDLGEGGGGSPHGWACCSVCGCPPSRRVVQTPCPRPAPGSHSQLTLGVTAFTKCWVAQTVKSLPAVQETQVQFLGQENPLERKWLPTPVFLPGKSRGRRRLAGYSPWGHKEPDTTERLHFHFMITNFMIWLNLISKQ